MSDFDEMALVGFGLLLLEHGPFRVPQRELEILNICVKVVKSPVDASMIWSAERQVFTIDDTARNGVEGHDATNSDASGVAAPLAESDAAVPEAAAALTRNSDEAYSAPRPGPVTPETARVENTMAAHATNDDAGSRRQK